MAHLGTRSGVLVGGVIAAAIFSACRPTSGPTTTEGSALPFHAGTYRLMLSTASEMGIDSRPVLPACPGISSASIDVDVVMDAVGDAWRMRPKAPNAGDFEILLRRDAATPTDASGSPAIVGTASGTIVNVLFTLDGSTAGAPSMRLGGTHGAATLSGSMSWLGYAGGGFGTGDLVVTLATGTSYQCSVTNPNLQWSFSAL